VNRVSLGGRERGYHLNCNEREGGEEKDKVMGSHRPLEGVRREHHENKMFYYVSHIVSNLVSTASIFRPGR
jgi:hypothetical protein